MFTKDEKELIQDAFDKISAIPSENIIRSLFGDGKSSCCIIGHLVRLESKNPQDYSEENCSDYETETHHPMRILSAKYFHQKFDSFHSIVYINNMNDCVIDGKELYPQETPKERCLACLEDMLKAETVEVAEA